MVKKAIDKLKLKLFGNDEPPVQIPVDEDYVVVGEEYSSNVVERVEYGEEDIVKDSQKSKLLNEKEILNKNKMDIKEEYVAEPKPEIKVIKEEITPKLLTARINAPEDFNNLKKIIEHDIIIINLEDIPVEAIIKEFSDFRKYLEIMDYNLGKIDENVIIAVKSGIKLDKYSSSNTEQ
jgi:hypothetical protein